ncbi:MAG: ABC transporter substrate-binding protein [Granulosicoccus sp.]
MDVSLVSRTLLLAAALLLPPVISAQHTVKQPRVVSINLCTDQMVMLLADPDQIIGLSRLSRDPAGSLFHEKAQDYRQVDPYAEELLPLAPDFVAAGPYTSRYTLNLLDELGIPVEIFPIANSIEEMLGNLERMGQLLVRQEQAESIADEVRQRLSTIKSTVAAFKGTRPRAAVYDTNGYTVGHKTVRGQMMALSGWENVAIDHGIESYGVLGLEQLIALRPQALIESPYSEATYSRGQMLTRHPAIRASGLNPLIIHVPSNQTICAGPWAVDVIQQLVNARGSL